MTNEQQQTIGTDSQTNTRNDSTEGEVRQIMAALSVMLSGASGKDGDFGRVEDLMLIAGAPLTGSGLLWLGQIARMNARNVMHVSMTADSSIPKIAMAVLEGDRLTMIENCMLLVEKRGRPMTIVPDSFEQGGYRLRPDGRMKRCSAPKSFNAATPAMVRAYIRFHELRATLDASAVAPLRIKTR